MIFIAEIGLNHNGNPNLTFELIRKAAWAGADIAKFQLGWRAGKDELNEITPDWLDHIIQCCKYCKIEPMVSVFTPDAWEVANTRPFSYFKVASRTVKDEPALVDEIIKSGKEVIISLGMWESGDLPFGTPGNVSYLWCKSKYPSYPWDLADLPKQFENTPYEGYSDHSVGVEIPLLAIARGSKIIEKHFSLDKSDVTIRDHALSATPEEFASLVEVGRKMQNALEIGV